MLLPLGSSAAAFDAAFRYFQDTLMSLDFQNLGVPDPFANDTTKAGGVGGNASTHLIRKAAS